MKSRKFDKSEWLVRTGLVAVNVGCLYFLANNGWNGKVCLPGRGYCPDLYDKKSEPTQEESLAPKNKM